MTDADGPGTHFVVMATGQIEAGRYEGHDTIYCRYAFSFGEDWTVNKGVEEGITQMSTSSSTAESGAGQVAVWNFPIDVTFRATCPHGWPQIVLSVYGSDSFGRSDQILGYGAVHLPMAPGRHVLYVRTFRPVAAGEELLYSYGRNYWDAYGRKNGWVLGRADPRRLVADNL